MATTSTLARFGDLAAADRATASLRDQGFSTEQIGVLMSEATRSTLPVGVTDDRAEEGVATGGAVGLLLGGLLAIPAGPPGYFLGGALAVMWGALTGGAAGSLIGMLAGMGMTHEEATVLQEKIEVGEVVVTVATTDPTRTTVAENTLRKEDPKGRVVSYLTES